MEKPYVKEVQISRTRQVDSYEPIKIEIKTQTSLDGEELENYLTELCCIINKAIEEPETDPIKDKEDNLDDIPFDKKSAYYDF